MDIWSGRLLEGEIEVTEDPTRRKTNLEAHIEYYCLIVDSG